MTSEHHIPAATEVSKPSLKGRSRICAVRVLVLMSLPLPGWAMADEVVEYIHTDALGSPVAITDAAGNVIERTVYEPYGAVVNRQLNDGPGYAGHVTDSATGLTYMQQRYFDAQTGVFLSVDPVAANESAFGRYAYASNNPYRFTDPDGRAPLDQLKTLPKPKEATVGSRIKGGGVAAGARVGTIGGGGGAAKQAPASSSQPAPVPKGFFGDTLNLGAETEVVAAYGPGIRYTRDWKDKKDSAGIIPIGVGVRGGIAGRVTGTGLPSLEVIKVGFNWGSKDAPVDIVGSFSSGFLSGAVNFDPGTGLNVSFSLSPSFGGYDGVAVMFDDTLIPDR